MRFRELGIVLALVIVVGGTAIDNHLFLSAHEPAAAALGRVDRGAARDRRDARDRDPQRRPLDRLDPRALGVHDGRHLRPQPARADRRRAARGRRPRARVRRRQRRHRHALPRAQPRRHAGHAVRDPRHRRQLGGRQPGRRLQPARLVQLDRLRQGLRRPVPRHRHDPLRRGGHLRDAASSGRAATSTRSARTPRPRTWPASPWTGACSRRSR